MMKQFGPGLIGAAIGMLLFWGMGKLLPGHGPAASALHPVRVEIPALTPVPSDAKQATPATGPGTLQTAGIRGAESGELTAGIRGTEGGELTAGIRGADSDEMVGTMVDRPAAGTAPADAACFDHEVLPRAVVAPDYPFAARRDGVEGSVEVEFTVGVDGRVSDAQVVGAEPAAVFDQSALTALQRWRFEPRTVACAPVAARVRQQLQFRLDAGQ